MIIQLLVLPIINLYKIKIITINRLIEYNELCVKFMCRFSVKT